MKLDAYVAGVGMTRFGKHMDMGLKALGAEAVQAALTDAGLAIADLEAAWVGNAAAGVITGQESIRGEVILRGMGIGKIPVVNVENACASASTALHQACAMVTAGLYDTVLALGVEKLLVGRVATTPRKPPRASRPKAVLCPAALPDVSKTRWRQLGISRSAAKLFTARLSDLKSSSVAERRTCAPYSASESSRALDRRRSRSRARRTRRPAARRSRRRHPRRRRPPGRPPRGPSAGSPGTASTPRRR